jgi:hypothetical protein
MRNNAKIVGRCNGGNLEISFSERLFLLFKQSTDTAIFYRCRLTQLSGMDLRDEKVHILLFS